ncbi:MAG TPA: HD domain-containing phosphohydrolase, partial [Negativicutes bacterium]|nr:HD domain-containing phosphohydrolase [Negativicutes bacterium]
RLTGIAGVGPIVAIMRHHHERWDGSGYPDGLKDKDIPLLSRMLALCDAFDAMTAARCYRTPVPLRECVREIWRCAGSQFDPVVAAAFIEFIRERFGYTPEPE